MSDITPDLIASIATKLLNDLPASPESVTPPTSGQVPSWAAAYPHQSSGMPSFGAGDPIQQSATSLQSATAVPNMGSVPSSPPSASSHFGTSVPVEFPGESVNPPFSIPSDIPKDIPHHQIADVSPEGLRRFVEQIRNPTPTTHLEFCEGRPGLALWQQLFNPAVGQSVPQVTSGGSRALDVHAIRKDFPALHQRVHGKPLIWFDNAATTQKPQAVIDAISHYYAHDNSNIHRAAHTLAARSTDAFEGARETVQKFLGAGKSSEIIFVRGTTEGINLIAQTYGRKFLQPGDEIVLSTLEHHANIVPWQMIAKEKGAVIRVIPVNDRGEIILEQYQAILGPKTKLVALTQASNSLGTILPVHEMTQMAKRYGARVVIDGAQSVSHIPVNVQELGCDFFVFSGHKIFGPTGIGAVFAKEEVQEIMPPWQGGGNMIRTVTFEETTYSDPPAKFEAGTPNIADTVGLGAALKYVQQFGLQNIGKYEHFLLEYATERLRPIPGLRLLGEAQEKVSVISFVLKDRRTEDVGKLLDLEGIAVRAGHHCSQPSLRRYGVEATVRPSLAFYNTTDEIDHLVASVKRISIGTVTLPTAGHTSPQTVSFPQNSFPRY